MVVIRKRGRFIAAVQGSQIHIPSGTLYRGGKTNQLYMEDVIGNRDAANYLFQESRVYDKVGLLDGQASAFPTYRYKSYPYFSQDSFSHLPAATSSPDPNVAVTMAASATNPSKPTVSMPLFIYELKDFVPSLQRYGERKLRKLHSGPHGDHYAENYDGTAVDFNFGWDLLFKDVAQMFKFTRDVDRRVKQLTAAHGVRGARGRQVIWSDVQTERRSGLPVWTLEASVSVTEVKTTRRKMWASVRWLADSPGLPPADQTLADARRIVHGWRVSPSDIWQAIPWSWFVDYFVNIGDYLEANTNALGIHYDRGCVMLETETLVRHEDVLVSDPGIAVTPARYRYITRERTPATPSLGFYSVPFLGPKQLVTLSSIALSGDKYRR